MTAPIHRRQLLGGLAAGLFVAGAPRVAVANAPGERRFVLVILRGGLDGLAAVPAYGDPAYVGLRGVLGLGLSDGVIPLDGLFGLHPALAPLQDFWAKGEMQVVHAAATPYRERSHFDAQNVLETGGALPSGLGVGWLNRALQAMGGPVEAVAVGQIAPLALHGPKTVGTWAPGQDPDPPDVFLDALDRLYQRDEPFHLALASARATGLVMTEQELQAREPGARELVPSFRGLARLLRETPGPRLATVEVNGWDTHSGQGTLKGRLPNRLSHLAEGLAALRRDLGPAWGQTVVAVATEFGRTAQPNGSGGTDHGTAGASFVLGGALSGSRIVADWPGLGLRDLHQGRDLAPTTDLRAMFAGILGDHLRISDAALTGRVFSDAAALKPLRDFVRA